MITGLLRFIELIIWFIIIWVLGFVLHEYCHKLAGWLQGVKCDIKIWRYNGIPSMMCTPRSELSNKYEFLVAGGGFSGITMIGISAYSIIDLGIIHPITISMSIVGLINLVYAFFHESINHPMINSEWTLAKYMYRKNEVYSVAFAVGLLVMALPILRFFGVI